MSACVPDNAIWPDPSILDNPEITADQIERALAYGWGMIQTLSGYSISICPITVRPPAGRGGGRSYTIAPVNWIHDAPFHPIQTNTGDLVNVLCCGDNECGCDWVRGVHLPGPVGPIVSVVIGGVEIPPSAYRVDDNHMLVRQDGEAWPYSQDQNLPAGDPGTFLVTYYRGAVADGLVRYAAGTLASEYLKAVTGDTDCRLPSGTTNIIRQGLTIEIEKDIFENGLTGIPEVDTVTGTYNPYRLKTPPAVFSIDTMPARQTTFFGG